MVPLGPVPGSTRTENPRRDRRAASASASDREDTDTIWTRNPPAPEVSAFAADSRAGDRVADVAGGAARREGAAVSPSSKTCTFAGATAGAFSIGAAVTGAGKTTCSPV